MKGLNKILRVSWTAKKTNEVKGLGVIVDSHLSFDAHITAKPLPELSRGPT